MAKKKEDALEVVEDKETIIMEYNPGDNAMAFLEQHMEEIPYDPGFMKIQPNKGAKTFNFGALGTKDSPVEAIVLSVSISRTLWPPDDVATTEQLAGVIQCMPDDIGKYSQSDLKDWSNGRPLCMSKGTGTKGEFAKILDADAPDIAPLLMDFPAKAGYNCAKCRWNEYETDFKGGRGKACQEKHLLLLWFPAEEMAAFVAVPPTSLKVWRSYKISLPNQNVSANFTAISTVPYNNGKYDYNLFDFAPVKDGGKIVPVTPADVASLGAIVSYNGQDVIKLKALIAEFLAIELEDEEEEGKSDAAPESPVSDAVDGDEDTPF